MAESLTVSKCFELLGIPPKPQNHLKRDILEALKYESEWGGDLANATLKSMNAVAAKFLQPQQLSKYRPSDFVPTLEETDLHNCLLRLVIMLKKEKTRQESQEDPSWVESASPNPSKPVQKRKRPLNHAACTNSPVEKQNKRTYQARTTVSHPPRHTANDWSGHARPQARYMSNLEERAAGLHSSHTAISEADKDSTQDLPFRDVDRQDDEDDPELMEISELIPSRSGTQKPDSFSQQVSSPPSARKGKTVVRDPPASREVLNIGTSPTTDPQTPSIIRSATINIEEPDETQRLSEEPVEITTPSPTSARRVLHTSRSFRDPTDLEESGNAAPSFSKSSTIPGFDEPAIAKRLQQPQPMETPPSPPPTVRTARFADYISALSSDTLTGTIPKLNTTTSANQTLADIMSAPNAIPSTASFNGNDGQLDLNPLLTQILSYIQACEEHSIKIAQNPSSSTREVEKHRIRAGTFAHLRDDVGSRIAEYLREGSDSDANGATKVTSYCLWY